MVSGISNGKVHTKLLGISLKMQILTQQVWGRAAFQLAPRSAPQTEPGAILWPVH